MRPLGRALWRCYGRHVRGVTLLLCLLNATSAGLDAWQRAYGPAVVGALVALALAGVLVWLWPWLGPRTGP